MQFSCNLSKISVELNLVDVRLPCFGKSNLVSDFGQEFDRHLARVVLNQNDVLVVVERELPGPETVAEGGDAHPC